MVARVQFSKKALWSQNKTLLPIPSCLGTHTKHLVTIRRLEMQLDPEVLSPLIAIADDLAVGDLATTMGVSPLTC